MISTSSWTHRFRIISKIASRGSPSWWLPRSRTAARRYPWRNRRRSRVATLVAEGAQPRVFEAVSASRSAGSEASSPFFARAGTVSVLGGWTAQPVVGNRSPSSTVSGWSGPAGRISYHRRARPGGCPARTWAGLSSVARRHRRGYALVTPSSGTNRPLSSDRSGASPSSRRARQRPHHANAESREE